MAIAKLKSKIVISPLIICPNWLIQVDGGFLLAIVVMIRMMLMTIYVLVRALKPFLSLVYSSGHCCDITDDVDDNAGDNVCFG